jgi:hypothetical protein
MLLASILVAIACCTWFVSDNPGVSSVPVTGVPIIPAAASVPRCWYSCYCLHSCYCCRCLSYMSSYRRESDYCYRAELICLWTVKISNIGPGKYENYQIKGLQLSDYRKSDRNKNIAFFQISFFFLLFLYFIVA